MTYIDLNTKNQVRLTDYHAKYFAHELTKRCGHDNVDKFASALSDAQVDLNPHQVDSVKELLEEKFLNI